MQKAYMRQFEKLANHWCKRPHYICHAARHTLGMRKQIKINQYLSKTGIIEKGSGILEYQLFQAATKYPKLAYSEFFWDALDKVNYSIEMVMYRVRLLEELRQELFCKLED